MGADKVVWTCPECGKPLDVFDVLRPASEAEFVWVADEGRIRRHWTRSGPPRIACGHCRTPLNDVDRQRFLATVHAGDWETF